MAPIAFAQNAPQVSEAQAKGEKGGPEMGVTNFAVRPSVGAIFYNGNQQFTGGLLMDFNVVSSKMLKIGPATGALYSSVDQSNFFSGISTSNGLYIFQIPADLKVTIAPDPARRWQIGAHGGANVIYSSSGLGTEFGTSTPVSGPSWDVHPNVGADLDFALGTNADLTLRPDWTFMTAYNMVTTTLGLALKL